MSWILAIYIDASVHGDPDHRASNQVSPADLEILHPLPTWVLKSVHVPSCKLLPLPHPDDLHESLSAVESEEAGQL